MSWTLPTLYVSKILFFTQPVSSFQETFFSLIIVFYCFAVCPKIRLWKQTKINPINFLCMFRLFYMSLQCLSVSGSTVKRPLAHYHFLTMTFFKPWDSHGMFSKATSIVLLDMKLWMQLPTRRSKSIQPVDHVYLTTFKSKNVWSTTKLITKYEL